MREAMVIGELPRMATSAHLRKSAAQCSGWDSDLQNGDGIIGQATRVDNPPHCTQWAIVQHVVLVLATLVQPGGTCFLVRLHFRGGQTFLQRNAHASVRARDPGIDGCRDECGVLCMQGIGGL